MATEPKAERSSVGRKLLAVSVLLIAGYVLLKFVLRLATKFAWLALVILAVFGLIWAMFTLTRD